MIKNTFPDKLRNPESLKKRSQQFENSSTNVGFAEGVIKVVLFSVLRFKWSVKKSCIANVLLAIWEIFLHEYL